MRSVLATFAILAAPYLASAQSDNPFNGTGQIWVISGDDSTDLAKPPTPRIGCLANNGHVTSSNCGTFTVNRASNQPLKTSAGVCTFFDTTAELGRPLAPMFWALKCGKGPWSTQDPGYEFYHLNTGGQDYTYIWNGNLNYKYATFDVPAAGQEVPIWPKYAAGDAATNNVRLYWNKLG